MNLQIYLPEGYNTSEKKYPVIYILDGQRYFLNGVVYQKNLKFKDATPDFIVIGININTNERDKFFVTEKHTFTKFISSELTPYVNTSFRTNGESILFGWERAGKYALEILIDQPTLFDGYIIASPTMLSSNVLSKLHSRLYTPFEKVKFLSFGISTAEYWSIDFTDTLAEILKTQAPKSLVWKYDLLEDEDHYSTPTKVIHNGVKHFFSDYNPLRFYSMKEFTEFGGLNPLYAHYKKRGLRYKLPTDIHQDTKHYLFLQAFKEDNIEMFEMFAYEFKNFLRSLKNDFWFNRFGQFYLKHKRFDEAIDLFRIGLSKFPNSALLTHSLNTLYQEISVRDKTKNTKPSIRKGGF